MLREPDVENRKSDKNNLIKKYSERQDYDSYENALGRNQRGQGIYILYDGDEVYYVGLSRKSLRSRLRKHATNDRHKGKWDSYSFYQIDRINYIKDVETLLLRVIKPKGNRVGGKLRSRYNLALASDQN
jgi:hypothetical protein